MSSERRPGRTSPGPSSVRAGFYAVGAYLLWGLLPLYFLALAPSSAFEIVGWRVIFALLFCLVLITATRRWKQLIAVFREPRLVFVMAIAGALIYVNWQTYVLATTSGHVVEASLGYFINPIVTILLGVFFLKERLRRAQWIALGISAVAVIVLAVGYGAVPWISLVLAFSFGTYGLVKKKVGPRIDAVNGLTLESMWLVPIVVVQLCVVGATTGLTFGNVSGLHTAAMVGAGVVTAVPLLLFASASKGLALSTLGFIQYLTPVIQFVIGVLVLGEPMPPQRLAGFALVWVALVILSVDAVRTGRRNRRSAGLRIANDIRTAHTENTLET